MGDARADRADRADWRQAAFEARTSRLRAGPGRLASRVLLFAHVAGPGVLVFLGENDAPSMLSYAATGAGYGIGFFLPFVVLTFALGYIVQEMAARIGAVTGQGHAELIFDRFGSFWGRFAMGDLLIGNFLTLITEFIGIRAGLGFFGVPAWIAVGGAIAIVLLAASTARYNTWERIALLLAAGNAVFVPVAMLSRPDWHAVGGAMLTWSPLPGGLKPETITLMVADVGATVTPWMLFFQQGAVADKGLGVQDIRATRFDTALGSVLAAVFAIASIIATAPLFTHGISAGNWQAAQFAEALRPLIGQTGAALFAIGIFEAGLVAAITISTSSAYAFGEVTGAAHSLNASFRDAWAFYAVLGGSAAIAGALVLTPGMPLEQVVIIVNVIAVLAMPPALVFLILIANDTEVMGPHRNGRALNLTGIGATVLLVLVGLAYAANVLFPNMLG